MTRRFTKYNDELQAIAHEHMVPVLIHKLEEQEDFIDKLDKTIKKLMSSNYLEIDRSMALDHFAYYKETLFSLVDTHFEYKVINDFDKEFAEFNTELVLFIESLEETLVEEQVPERFESQKSDSALIKIGKWFKRIFRAVGGWPLGSANMFRVLFRRPKKDRKKATHHIKFRNLGRYYLKERFSLRLTELLNTTHKVKCITSKMLWEVDEQIDTSIDNFLTGEKDMQLAVELSQRIPEAKEQLEACKSELKALVDEVLVIVLNDFWEAYEKVGTFELSNRRFGPSPTAKKHHQLNQKCENLNITWNNTLLALSDDWEIDLELYATIYRGLEAFQSSRAEIASRIDKNIKNRLNEIADVLIASKNSIKADNIEEVLKQELSRINNELEQKLLPKTTEMILAQDLPSLINAIEADLNSRIAAIVDKRAIVKGADYTSPIRTSAISFISPQEFIYFESWPQFQEVGQKCKAHITASLSVLQQELSQIGQIASFNLETALSIVDDVDESNNPIDVSKDGLERTIQKTKSLEKYLDAVLEYLDGELLISLQKFNHSLVKLTDNENIFEIRVRIAKAKAIEKSKRLKQEWVKRIRNLLPLIWVNLRGTYDRGATLVRDTFKRYGLSREKVVISTEIADFLAETQLAIEKLPFVYQRLFRSVATKDEHLFEGRKRELNELNQAYTNWTRGRFAATAIIGEKGQGITTMLNFFEAEISTSFHLHRMDLCQSIKTADQLTAFFSTQFGQSFKTTLDIAAYLNEQPKRVIVLENIQKNYLKKVGGFEAMYHLEELISMTNKKVFWVTTCTVYAWSYLDKTIRISDHFSYLVRLQEFNDNTMVNIIMKRHQISGYNLKFEPSRDHLNNKKFKKLSEDERQTELKEEYFEDLNKIASSNISLALIFWLRSTSEVSDNTIFISSLRELDFAFMKNLPMPKLYALTMLLVHDGLSEEDFCIGTSLKPDAGRAILRPLLEDGIIEQKQGLYQINPLLYRQTVSLLKVKNIIH